MLWDRRISHAAPTEAGPAWSAHRLFGDAEDDEHRDEESDDGGADHACAREHLKQSARVSLTCAEMGAKHGAPPIEAYAAWGWVSMVRLRSFAAALRPGIAGRRGDNPDMIQVSPGCV